MSFRRFTSLDQSQSLTSQHDTVQNLICDKPHQDKPFTLSQHFAADVYGITQIEATLPKPVFKQFLSQVYGNKTMEKHVADAVAHAVKVWACERGATHFTHWFQPLTNSTAEKHDSFLSLNYETEGGAFRVTPLETFSGSQLMQAEPDASSFPHGGVRTTFEARGYSVWDTTSPMFLQQGPHNTKILYIPSIFISYNGEALDEKTILLRSCAVVSKKAVQLLNLLGDNKTKKVHVTLGTEQEFFLVDKNLFALRPDLKLTGRALIGCVPPKHQQLEDHYFGHIPSKVLCVLGEAEIEMWRVGVPVKTRHNEVAPRQFEMAPIFEEASVAVDHNLLMMQILKKVAHNHGLKALFHEKPFQGVNGSGKHCNWSLCTDTGKNLLEPTANPENNQQFQIFLLAILLALKKYSGLLTAAIASSSNEHRLGANEAPPSIISAFIGAQLTELLNSIEEGRPFQFDQVQQKGVNIGATSIDMKISHLPEIYRDTTDRNRTSPFAFTGNKFEFRAVGSSQSPSFPMTVLNAATASALSEVYQLLVNKQGQQASLTNDDIQSVIRDLIKQTKVIRFEGDGYSAEWVVEAEKRGLLNLKNAPDAFKQLLVSQNKKMLVQETDIVNESELVSRYNVLCEKYTKDLVIESKTLKVISQQMILPAVFKYRTELSKGIQVQQSVANIPCTSEIKLLQRLSTQVEKLYEKLAELDASVLKTETLLHQGDNGLEAAAEQATSVLKPLLKQIAELTNTLEQDLADSLYPMPKYYDLLFQSQ